MRHLSETALFTRDVPAMAAFYRAVMGCDPVHADENIAIFKSGAVTLLIHAILDTGEGEPPCEDHHAFNTPNTDDVFAALRAQGLHFEHAPRSYPWGRSAYLRDPDGRLVELHQEQTDGRDS